MARSSLVPFLIAGMLVTGCANSLLMKWQDRMCVENCEPGSGRPRVNFEQPVWQTLIMFSGEMLCFLPVIWKWYTTRNLPPQLPSTDEEEEPAAGVKAQPDPPLTGWKLVYFWLPAFCDLAGTTLMNVGLLYTPVSIYQMTRGALVLWVVLFGLSGSLIKNVVGDEAGEAVHAFMTSVARSIAPNEPEPTTVFVGVLFVLFAQFFTATQFVVEEKIMKGYTIEPLMAVGLEGLFGALSILVCMPILAPLASRSPFFDFPRGWHQIIDHTNVVLASVLIMFSIASFNFFGLSVTFRVSATARSTTDTCRTLGIWIVSLGLGWEHLAWPYSVLQIIGFALLVYGTFLFNNLVEPPAFIRPVSRETAEDDERRALLAEQHLNETATLPADAGQSGFDVVPPTPPARG
ncbi:Nucleotide-sugar transporter [Rhizoctonia solani]|uniref:Nucleotide-sugar transporter n=1 Tax=Rhizoctonia solani TaxID=456999 RepID=A0A8H7M7T6_9AGAM|nr:Nucleotide-sugar transporter [Rhizoctonia solani]